LTFLTALSLQPACHSLPYRPIIAIQLKLCHRADDAGDDRNLTYLLTPWCRVLLEQLTGLQLVKIFPAFHGNRRFIAALTSVRHLSLSWASPIQSIYPHPTTWRSILILSTHLRLGLRSGLQSKYPACECFLTGLFYREGLLALRPKPSRRTTPSTAVRDRLFNLFAATLPIRRPSSIRNLKDEPCRGDRDPLHGTETYIEEYSSKIPQYFFVRLSQVTRSIDFP